MSKEILLNKLEKQFSYYELVDEMQETINYSKIVDFLENEKDKQIADLETKLAEKEKAFDLMSIVLCTGARDDLKKQLGKFTWREDVKQFFLEQAKKELENGTK